MSGHTKRTGIRRSDRSLTRIHIHPSRRCKENRPRAREERHEHDGTLLEGNRPGADSSLLIGSRDGRHRRAFRALFLPNGRKFSLTFNAKSERSRTRSNVSTVERLGNFSRSRLAFLEVCLGHLGRLTKHNLRHVVSRTVRRTFVADNPTKDGADRHLGRILSGDLDEGDDRLFLSVGRAGCQVGQVRHKSLVVHRSCSQGETEAEAVAAIKLAAREYFPALDELTEGGEVRESKLLSSVYL